MTYFSFLALFLAVPILVLLGLTWRDKQQGCQMPRRFASYPPWLILLLHLGLALLYTTPWDNYLVATSVWWYDPAKVTGITFGYVPIEEYTFFLVQPLLTGLWLLFWLRRQPNIRNRQFATDQQPLNSQPNVAALILLGLLWLTMLLILLIGWKPGTYLALILIWALPPIMLQVGFGGHILWQHRRVVLLGLLPTTLFLAAADAIAIADGIWTIDPQQSLGWLIGGILPFEEFLFFLITNVLVIFGITLFLAIESQEQLAKVKTAFTERSWSKLPVKVGVKSEK